MNDAGLEDVIAKAVDEAGWDVDAIAAAVKDWLATPPSPQLLERESASYQPEAGE